MIINVNKRELEVTGCTSFLSQSIGLMFKFNLKNDGLLFIFNKEKKVALHMFFVFFPIDIVYLNSDKKVIKILKNVKPFTLYIPGIKSKYILELKNSKDIKLGDKFIL